MTWWIPWCRPKICAPWFRPMAKALAAIRQTVTLGGSMSFDDGLALERAHVVRLAGTDNFREGLAAFVDKRMPEWKG